MPGYVKSVFSEGHGELVEMPSIPAPWYPWYWPQWAGEEAVTAATPLPSLADEGRAFAEPILAAIADRPPDFEDDFSDPASDWPRGLIVDPSGWEEGEHGYVDGEYYVIAPAAELRPKEPEEPVTCASGFLINHRSFSDLVLEVEGRYVTVQNGNWHVNFRQWYDPATDVDGKYEVRVLQEGAVELGRYATDEGLILMAQLQGLPALSGPETNRLQIVAVGPQIALYVNGAPALYINDPGYTERFKAGRIKLLVCHKGVTPLRVHYDNLKVWDISDLSP